MVAEGAAAAGGEWPIDLEAYAALYTGHTKLKRLLFIGEKAAPALALEALRMAADEVKNTDNTAMYTEIMEKIAGRLGPQYTYSREYFEETERRANMKIEKLEQELSQAKTNLVKESIRLSHNSLGDAYFARGDLSNAFKCYVRTRDYCQTSKHSIDMCLNIIRASIALGNYVHVQSYVQKAEASPDASADPAVVAKLRVAAGLSHLDARKFKMAARKFCETPFEVGSDFNDVVSPQDVATYGGLCALATFTRQELRSKVLDNVGFSSFLELTPELREVISDFYNSKYAPCIAGLERLRAPLKLDLHLWDHASPLLEQIRQRALVQYVQPFTAANLNLMAQAFNTTVAGVEKEVAQLIADGQIAARIDSQEKVLFARHADQRNGTFEKAQQAGEDFRRETRALLLRARLLQNDLVVRGKGGRGGGGGGHGSVDKLDAMLGRAMGGREAAAMRAAMMGADRFGGFGGGDR